jgi:CelD/BcsL family acetyltransferase involved in cellulose biosynthesis
MSLESVEHVIGLVPEWDELCERLGSRPWLRPGWILAWWDAFGSGRLEVLTARRAGRLVGLVPLAAQKGVHRSTTNWHTPEFAILAEDEEARRELASAALEGRPRQLVVSFLDPHDSGLAECREQARAAGYRVLERTIERSPYLPIETDWERFHASLGHDFRRHLRRRRRQLEQLGELRFELHDGSRHLDELLDEGFRVEASGWKGENGTAIDSSADTRRFYGSVARWAAARGWLRLAFLRLTGDPIAFEFMLESQGVAYDIKSGYDETFRYYGPGKLLACDILEHAFRRGLQCFEFLGTEDEFKAQWTRAAHERRSLQAFAPSLPGLVDWTAWAVGRPVAKRALQLLGRR